MMIKHNLNQHPCVAVIGPYLEVPCVSVLILKSWASKTPLVYTEYLLPGYAAWVEVKGAHSM